VNGGAARILLLAALVLPGGACSSNRHDAPPSPPAPGAASTAALSNTIRWTTASEVDNFGFDVYRGESTDGPFRRLNATPIEGGGTTDEPRAYAFVDDTIEPHRTYYYYVESISMSGERQRFTPIGKADPKLPAGAGGQRSSGTGTR
jgi:hypothetical protein